ncbi:hypothetical protein, partial [Mangrovicoccus algicola]|nr:hypothetical protein [Mangrovicoccus algicola]
GAALSCLGALAWAAAQPELRPGPAMEIAALAALAAVAGGPGSVAGCLLAALLAGLGQAYAGVLWPGLAGPAAAGLLAAALILQPAGLIPRGGAR